MTQEEREFEAMMAENRRRKEVWAAGADYEPLTGRGCAGERVAVKGDEGEMLMVPRELAVSGEWERCRTAAERDRLRCRYDFEFWAARCVTIRDKITGQDVRWRLNRPQRRVAAMIEEDRRAGRPLRLIMLKARQWGGSTLVQMYFAWIQIVHRRNWHSFICAHVKDTSATIRGMYAKLLANYPAELWPEEEAPAFSGFERSINTRLIAGRGCHVTLASSENQESARGNDVALAHLSEVAFWRDSLRHSPEDFIRSVCSGIALSPLTFIAMESTANGVGNFFHKRWLQAGEPDSGTRRVFVPWHEIDMYRMEVADPRGLIATMDDYERQLWRLGLTLEQICWYRRKRADMPSHQAMMAEYPTTDTEAFVNSATSVFDREAVARLRELCPPPESAERGEVSGREVSGRGALCGVEFHADPTGGLTVWERPEGARALNGYVVTVDVGGKSAGSDWSVICVMNLKDDKPRVVAQWRGHIDHDLLGWKAAAIATWYQNALLVVESNSLETVADGGSRFILEELNRVYRPLYRRRVRDRLRQTMEQRLGFHTNAATKTLAVTSLIQHVREGAYVERDPAACDEMDTYELGPNGEYGARRGCNDDILMTRAIGLYVASTLPVVKDLDLTGL